MEVEEKRKKRIKGEEKRKKRMKRED